MTRLLVVARPAPSGVVCARCGMDAPATIRRGARPWRCEDCREVECGRGHLWPDPPARDANGNRTCLLCANLRRYRTPTTTSRRATP